jgi:hypothetical protein
MPLSTVTITGSWETPAGAPATGRVIITPVASTTGGGQILAAEPVVLTLTNGSIDTLLVDNTQVTTLQYQVIEQIDGSAAVTYVITPTGGALDLSTAPRGTSTTAVPLYPLASTVGQPDGLATLGADGTLTAGQRPVTTTTKRVTLGFASPNGTPLPFGVNQITARALGMVNTTPTRYRFKLSNASAQNGSNPGAPVTVNTVWIGRPAYDDASHNSKWLGDLTTTPIEVYAGGGSLPTTGTGDLVTPWITNTGELAVHVPFVLSLGLTAGAGGAGVTATDCYGAIQYGATSANQAGVAVPPAGYNYSGFVLDVRLEYEFPAAHTDLVALVIGASGESGYSATGDLSSNPRALNDPVDAWPNTWATRHGVHVINAGIYGSATTDWLTTTGRPYTRFDLATTVPDVAIIGTMASNDISLGTAVATVIANYQTIVAGLKGLGIPRVFGVTLPPRALSGAAETARVAFNAYMRAIPDGVEDVFDFDLALRTPAAVSTMLADLVSADGIHPLRGGYRVLSHVPQVSA